MVAILIVVLTSATFKIYSISQNVGGAVLWNANEAYLFVGTASLGYSTTLLRLPWIVFKTYVIGGFAAVELPDDEGASLVVIRVTPSRIERHVVPLNRSANGDPGPSPSMYTPLEDRIYAFCPTVIGHFLQNGKLIANDMNDGLCWWASDHFEKATEDQRRRLGGISRLTEPDFDNRDGGWSKRQFGTAPAGIYLPIRVADKFGLSIVSRGKGSTDRTVSIDLLRPAKAPERIADFAAREDVISRSEYQHVFQNRE